MMRIDLNGHPYHAQLRMLGGGRDGRQWALITCQQPVSIDGPRPHHALRRLGTSRAAVRAAVDARGPARGEAPSRPVPAAVPGRWDGIYTGPWPDGDLPAPDGVEVLSNG
jgi:hypothetical protein